MALSIERLHQSSWNNAFKISAPLTWANKQIKYLSDNIDGFQSTYFSKILNLTPVEFNTTFLNLSEDNYYNFTSAGTVEPSLAQEYLRRSMGMASRSGNGIIYQNERFIPANQLKDLVALVTFVKISHLKERYPHIIKPVLLQGFLESNNSIIYNNFVSALVSTTEPPMNYLEEIGTLYDEWVVPCFEWYYLDSTGEYPRKKHIMNTTRETILAPFVPFVGNTLYFYNVRATEGFTAKQMQLYQNTFYFNLSPTYIPYINTAHLVNTPLLNPVDTLTYQWIPHDLVGEIEVPDIQKYSDDLPVPYISLLMLDNDDYNSFVNKGKVFKRASGIRPNIDGKTFFADLRALSANGCIAFETSQAALDYYADWGITCTQNLSEALNLPITPTKPVDPPVSTIPSYPDNTTDTIEISPPSFTASTFGQCKVYTPLNTTGLIKWLGTNTFWENINRLFANPIDAVFGLRLYNLDIVAHDINHVVASETTSILNVSTDIRNFTLSNGYNTIVNGGTYQYLAYYGNFADFINTTYDIFIPYVGIRRLNPSDVVNRNLLLKYAVDFATGNATVFLLSDNKLIMTTSCNVSAEIPLQTSNLNDVNFQTLMGVLTGAVSGTKTGFVTGAKSGSATGAAAGAILGGVAGGALSGLENYLNTIEYGYQGSVSGNNAFSMLEPFLLIKRFPLANVGDYQGLYGLANASTVTFSSITSGYIKADTVEIDTRATSVERDEIVALLQNGIHLE